MHALESGAHTALRYPSRFARICWWCARALIIRHVACSRAGDGHLLALRSPWTWSSREACNPSASPLSPPMKGKQKLSFPLPPKKASKFSARKNLQNSPLRGKKKLDSEQSIICLLLDREPHSLGVRVVARALELESQEESHPGLGLRRRECRQPSTGSRRRVSAKMCLLQLHVLYDFLMPGAFLFLRCWGWRVGRLATLVRRFSCNSAFSGYKDFLLTVDC